MMICVLKCPTTSGLNLNPRPLLCITREQEEQFVECYEQNALCHDALNQAASDSQPNWQTIALAIAGGLLTGMAIDSQLHH